MSLKINRCGREETENTTNMDFESLMLSADKSLSYIQGKKYTTAEKIFLIKKEITACLLLENKRKQLEMDKSRLEFLLNGIDTEYSPNEDTTVQYLKRRCSEEEYSIVVLPRSGFTFEKKNKEMIFSCKLNSDNVVIHSETGSVAMPRRIVREYYQYYIMESRRLYDLSMANGCDPSDRVCIVWNNPHADLFKLLNGRVDGQATDIGTHITYVVDKDFNLLYGKPILLECRFFYPAPYYMPFKEAPPKPRFYADAILESHTHIFEKNIVEAGRALL